MFTWTKSWIVVGAMALGALAGCPAFATAQALSGDALDAYRIQPASGIDESRFLMKFLTQVYRSWPTDPANTARAGSWVSELPWQVERLASHAKAKRLPADVVEAFADCTALLKRYEDYLVEIGAVERQAIERAQREREKLVEKGIENLGERLNQNWGKDGATRKVVTGTLGDALLAGFVDVLQQAERDAAKRDAINRARDRFAAALRATENQHANAAARIGGKGPDAFDLAASVRPDANSSAADVMRSAHALLDAARHVPEGRAYDRFKSAFLADASVLAAAAAAREWHRDTKTYGSKLAKDAVRICRTFLANDADVTDWGKYDCSQALHYAGLHGQALEMSSKAKKLHGNPDVAYNHACLLSVDRQTKLAVEWIAHACKCGFTDVAWARQDPDLENVRKAEGEAFGNVTKVKTRWNVVYGVVLDDIVLTNDSAFAITNVVLDVSFPNGNQRQARLTVPRIGPGQSVTWSSAVSVPRGRFGQATLRTSQD